MRKLGLADFGNVGGFNFTLNAPTELPNILVEVVFHDEVAERSWKVCGGF